MSADTGVQSLLLTGGTATVHFETPGPDGVGRIILDRSDDAVNAINPRVVADLRQALRAARATEGMRGLIVTSAKKGQWVAGADLKMVTQVEDVSQLELASRQLQAVCDDLAWLPCTTVAAINGAALGGGLEIALACDYRVASDTSAVTLGLPEVNLGLVPAGGGTQRLPRLIGLQRALDLILSGRRLNARRARRAGILDEVVHPTVLEQAGRAWAVKPKRPLDRPLKVGLSLAAAVDIAEQTPAGRQVMYRQARQAVLARTHGHYPAPLRALEAVEAGFEHGLAAGFEAESKAFGELALTPTAQHLIWLFMATQRQKRIALGVPSGMIERSRTADGEPPQIERLGVVGAGFMGAAIAYVGADAGLSVRVRDVDPAAVARGLCSIRQMVDDGTRRRGATSRERLATMQRLSGTTDYTGFLTTDLVIEAVFEELAVKQRVIADLEAVMHPTAVIASNTSALPIADIARGARNPERIVGMHFFSPAQRMPLLEVVRPAVASEEAVRTAVDAGVKMGKTVIVVADSPGFYTSRVLGVMMNEAALLLSEGASIPEVDRAMTAFGFPVGPFVLYDEVGLHVAQHAGETVTRAFGDRVPPATLVPLLVAQGQTGRKAGAGFYLWPKDERRLPGPLNRFVKRSPRVPNPLLARALGHIDPQWMTDRQVQDRLALLFVNEAIRCLEEGVLRSPTDGDLGAVLGLGFPPFHGGPFHYADTLGLDVLEQRLHALAQEHGSRFAPAAALVERAREGRRFYEE
jgi:3-hydroxyacyl-CoA dehydrogenase/enoyl-CoA hydratase/3-hydroxybutyryl-CoA epimerase